MEVVFQILLIPVMFTLLIVVAIVRHATNVGELAWRPPPRGGERFLTMSESGVRLTTRFVSYSEIASVSHSQRSIASDASPARSTVRHLQNVVVLHLHSGESIDVETVMVSAKASSYVLGSGPFISPDSETKHRLDLLSARVAAAKASSSGAPNARTSIAPPELFRNGRSPEEWLRALSNRSTEYRAPEIPVESLWRIVEDPLSPATARAAAAVALRGFLDEMGKTRLRAAAEASRSPQLRVALVAAADEAPDEELVKSLELLDD